MATLLKKKRFLLPHQRSLIFLDSQHLLTLVCASAVAKGRLCKSSYEFTASNLQRVIVIIIIIIIIISDVYFVIETMRVWVSSCKHYYCYHYYYWARSIQPKFLEISVQNSMDRFGPTGKVSKKRVHLLRWSSFPGRTGWNFG